MLKAKESIRLTLPGRLDLFYGQAASLGFRNVGSGVRRIETEFILGVEWGESQRLGPSPRIILDTHRSLLYRAAAILKQKLLPKFSLNNSARTLASFIDFRVIEFMRDFGRA